MPRRSSAKVTGIWEKEPGSGIWWIRYRENGALRQCVARTKNVEFFLDKKAGLITHRLFGVADVHNATGKSSQIHRSTKRLRLADRLDHDVGASSIGQLRQNLSRVLPLCMDNMRSARLARGRQLHVIGIHGNDGSPAEGRRRHSAETDTAAPEDRHNVCFCDAATRDGVATNGERLDETQLVEIQIRRIDGFDRNGNILRESAIPLYSQSLVIPARVTPVVTTGSTATATAVRRKSDAHSRSE